MTADEPAWCAPARHRTDDLNRDIAYARTAERERIAAFAAHHAEAHDECCLTWLAARLLEETPA